MVKPLLYAKKKLVAAGLNDGVRNVSQEMTRDPAEFLRTRAITGVMLSPPINPLPAAGARSFTVNRRLANANSVACLEPYKGAAKDPVIRAYWVPQGQSVDIPLHPNQEEPKYVFTPDFSGCSMEVDRMNAETLKVYHVEGGKEQAQYVAQDHGWGNAASMPPTAYGSAAQPRGFAMMAYRDGMWQILHQSQTSYQGPSIQHMQLALTEPQNVSRSGGIVVKSVPPPHAAGAAAPAAAVPSVAPAAVDASAAASD